MKKILGYIFIAVGGFLGISIVLQIPEIFKDVSTMTTTDTSKGTAHDFGFVMGQIIAMLIIITIIGFLIWLGRKWTKDTTTSKEVHDIGKEAKK